MSLLKQLLISVSLAILIILGGTLWLSVDSARSYLNTQLQAQTDSAATSLALTLSQLANQDPVTQELIIMAQFDSGQFNHIILTSPEGDVLFSRQVDQTAPSTVPAWFSRWLPIAATESVAQVSDGWRQVAQLSIQADAAYAQQSLWHSFTRLVAWVMGAGVLWALFVLFLMRWLRRVLHEEVAEQLNTLTNKDPMAAALRPSHRTTFSELTEVTQAIASARENIQATNEEQNAKIESLEVELNQDTVTGLVNRKYFVNELRRHVDSASTTAGWLFLFRQRDLAEVNRVMVRANVDEWLRSLSTQLQKILEPYAEQGVFTLARLNGSDFVVLAEGLSKEAMTTLIKELQVVLRQQRIQLPNGEFCRWAMAKTDFAPGQFLTHVLGRLDQALMRAESAGHNAVESLTSKQSDQTAEQPRGGETQWRTVIQDALLSGGFSLDLSAKEHQGIEWHEATLFLQSSELSNERLSAYQFMPVATRLGLSGVCDVRAFTLGLEWLEQNASARLVLRVSLSSVTQAGFADQVTQLFKAFGPEVTQRLYIELDAYSIATEPVVLADFGALLHQYEVKIGVRRALSLPHVLLDLATFNISYLRLLVDDLHDITQKEGGAILLRSALDIAKQAGVKILLQGNKQTLSLPIVILLQEYGIEVH